MLILGIVLCLFALFALLQYVFDYRELSDYGKGFIWGKLLMLLLGIAFIVIGRKKPKRTTN